MENFNIVWHYKDLLLKGLGYTVFVSVAAILIALCVGMLLSVMRMGGDSLPSRILKKIVAVYISFVRGTPVLVQIYIIYQALAVMGLNLSNLASGIIALSLNSGGFIAEIIRGGLTAVPKGQTEAARALGMSEPKDSFPAGIQGSFATANKRVYKRYKGVADAFCIGYRRAYKNGSASCNADIHKPAFLYCYRSYVFCYLRRT